MLIRLFRLQLEAERMVVVVGYMPVPVYAVVPVHILVVAVAAHIVSVALVVHTGLVVLLVVAYTVVVALAHIV